MPKYPNIIVRPPGPKAREIVERDEKVISQSFVRFYPLVIENGKGCILRDVDGNEYIDFNSGLVCLNVGHCHPKVIDAIKKQSDRYLHYSITDFLYREVVDLAEKLGEITPGKYAKKVFFGNSGAEAIEGAAKLAKWHMRRPRFIAFISAFHGRTLGAVSFTASKPVQTRYFFPMVPGVTHVPYPYCYRCPYKMTYPDCDFWCVDFIDEYVLQKYVPPEEVAAFVFEPIQGEGGYVVPPDDYFKRLKKLADKYGILLIDDEVQAGMGRTGKWCAIEHWNIEPDVVCLAKSIAAGMPLSAIVARDKIMDWEGGTHASTFGGNPVSCAAALAVIDIIKNEKLLDNATQQGAYIMKRMKEFMNESEIVGDVRGKGLMIGVEIVEDKKSKKPAGEKANEIMMRSWRRGVALITCGKSTLRIVPPLVITRDLVDSALDIITSTIKEVEKEK
ncbi:MAG: acetyl ornithine aminotransferase family protein [Candidatus Bathyarchaeia archaeon]|jgi:4-aminobutyrate aminotransferase|nr:acetyl ornithine aminotransferase family protein [Candidatus Bathyarchaeota archaeon A05DMB-4]MDH7594523.1 acetyl ornithine aminotransferase family protein [Candidatus Bathyarchaeota archaeon]